MPGPDRIDPETLGRWLADGDEIALLDAREQGVYFHDHLFHAASVPLSHLELTLPELVPRPSTRTVWCDDGADDLADRAAARSRELGYEAVSVLDGGTRAWAEHGGELYSGVNVPSKAFGELVEQRHQTPHIDAAALHELLASNSDVVVLDSRPMREFRAMSIPGGIDCPGAELVYRAPDMAPDPDTVVVVNCAGRTRSIIGTQSLINAGLPNRVVALENGTMGWQLAGYDVATGEEEHAPEPSARGRDWAATAAARVADRFGVDTIDHDQLVAWRSDDTRTTFLLDVRTPEEYEAGHLPGSVSAPGGQLVQATDEYVATRNARLVLVDGEGVRAPMTASWLRQLGWTDAVVLAHALSGRPLETGRRPRRSVGPSPTISVADLADELARNREDVAVIDIGTSLKYRQRGHIPGAWWGVRSRLDQARVRIGDAATVVITSTDGQLAKLAVADAAELWPESTVVALAGGNKAWRHAGHPMEPGFTRPTTSDDDVWYKPYERADSVADHMRDYLTWEVALVDQIARDPTVEFPEFG